MIARLTPIQRRLLAVILLLLVAIAVLRVVVVPIWSSYLNNREAIAQMDDTIARYTRLSGQVGMLRQAIEKLDKPGKLDEYVLAHDSEPLAAAALQELVKSVITSSGGTLTSTQVLPTAAEQGFKRIVIGVRMAGSVEALQRVLHALEGRLPYLLTDNVVILSRNARRRGRVEPSDSGLDIRFDLHGFMRATGGTA